MGPAAGPEWIADGNLEHLGGIPWQEALTPGRFHRCRPQTRGTISGHRGCACGAIRRDGHARDGGTVSGRAPEKPVDWPPPRFVFSFVRVQSTEHGRKLNTKDIESPIHSCGLIC
jgi:hypothetical protein